MKGIILLAGVDPDTGANERDRTGRVDDERDVSPNLLASTLKRVP